MATRAGAKTRDRIASEAPPTMWYAQNLLCVVLLARVLSRSRKKLPFEAQQVGLPAECRTRAELSDHCLAWTVVFLTDRRMALPKDPKLPDNEQGDEPSKAYRQDLKQHDDATYVNLRTTQGYPAMDSVSLRPMLCVGRSPRSSQREEQASHTAKADS